MIKNKFSKILLAASLFGLVQANTNSNAQLSLADLLNLSVNAGNLTGLQGNKVPVPITVVSKREIARTPHRNLIDIIEIYAPGAFQVSHQVPLLGMRGIVVDRNYKWLLLVNGRLMNQRGAEGAVEEIRHYNLEDVERLEIIRGPGSVTYGPGAVSGVINIITKQGADVDGFEVTTEYDQAYARKSGSVGYGFNVGEIEAYVHASGQWQDGADPIYKRNDKKTGAFGVMGVDVDTSFTMQPYHVQVEDEPYLKLHADIKAYENWRLWLRYTQANGAQNVANMNMVDYAYPGGPQDIPTRFSKFQSVTGVLENQTDLEDNVKITSTISLKTHDYILASQKIDTLPYYMGVADYKGMEENGNNVYSFAEHELFFKTLLNVNFTDDYRMAIGGAASFQSFTPRWQDEYNYAVFQPKLGTDDNGVLYQEMEKYGYGTMMLSAFGELNLGFHPLARALLSARVDKHQWSEFFLSPRLGMISELNEDNVLKLFWQKSLRMNTTSDMFREYVNGDASKPEELQSWELSYVTSPAENWQGKAYTYLNDMEVLGWNAGNNSTDLVGSLKYWGAEGEVNYQDDDYRIGLNHSAISMISWENSETATSQGISTADYGKKVDDDHTLESTGSHMQNVPHQVTKLFATVELPMNFWAHADIGLQWAWEGNAEVIDMYDKMLGNDEAWLGLKQKLEDEDYAGTEMFLNLALGYEFDANGFTGGVQIYGQNLLEQTTHTYSSGNKTLYPEKLQYIVEPATYGLKLSVNY